MKELTIVFTDAEWESMADLADAHGVPAAEFVRTAVRAHEAAEAARVRVAGEAYAAAHADLLRRLGE
ncbi:hypothetical protein OG539_18010 [Actinacidiphila glaucinigra]|uniref:hypothetical protein n=1 Tax=Actinacidiphila glaucinigra TaxID=235986 RepID=UPI002DDBC5CE|nr:hypothetical protein [Actinacidiphila glaucinigra]WSD61875.1 hypothetical protein OIE69_24765 [Actinacidiphila glaucinigra]